MRREIEKLEDVKIRRIKHVYTSKEIETHKESEIELFGWKFPILNKVVKALKSIVGR